MLEQEAWLAGLPAPLREALAGCAEGVLPANVAAMHLLSASSEAALERAIAAVEVGLASALLGGAARARLEELRRLIDEHPAARELVSAVLAEAAEHGAAMGGGGVAYWARAFDRAAKASAEASVALYSLGDPALLNAATAEVFDCLRGWGLLKGGRVVLDIGCGIGRVAKLVSPDVGIVVGIDISRRMLAVALERCAGLSNVLLVQTSGRDLAAFPDRAFDLILAVDVFPYLTSVGLGLVEVHVAEAARLLRPGGDLVVLNVSYRGNPESDRADMASFAARHGLTVLRSGERPFRFWDGLAFQLHRPV